MKKSPAYNWPYWLAQSLNKQQASKQKIKKLQTAQENLWQALNIYDDFLDGNSKAINLPLANRCYRNFLKTIYQSNFSPAFKKLADKILDNLDFANEKELTNDKVIWKKGVPKLAANHSNFSNLTSLADKSLALALAPIAAVTKGQLKSEKELLNFFRFSLAAKQLSDDAKDWLEDLKTGKLTAVNLLVISEGKKRKINNRLYRRPETFHLLFAHGAAIKTSHNILYLCQQARKKAKQIQINEQAPIIKKLITPLEKAAQKAINFQKLLD